MKQVRYIHVNVFEQLKHVFIFIKPQTAQCVILYSSWPHGSSDNVRKNGQFQLKTITSKSSLERKIYLYLLQMVNDNGLNIYGTGPYRHKFKVLIIRVSEWNTEFFLFQN